MDPKQQNDNAQNESEQITPEPPLVQLTGQSEPVQPPILREQKSKRRYVTPLIVSVTVLVVIVLGFVLLRQVNSWGWLSLSFWNVPSQLSKSNDEAGQQARHIAADIVSIDGVEKVYYHGGGAVFGNSATIAVTAWLKDGIDVAKAMTAISNTSSFVTESTVLRTSVTFIISDSVHLSITKAHGLQAMSNGLQKLGQLYTHFGQLPYAQLDINNSLDDDDYQYQVQSNAADVSTAIGVWNQVYEKLFSANCVAQAVCPSELGVVFPALNVKVSTTASNITGPSEELCEYATALGKKYTGDYAKLTFAKKMPFISITGLESDSGKLGKELYDSYAQDAASMAQGYGLTVVASGSSSGADARVSASGTTRRLQAEVITNGSYEGGDTIYPSS